MHQNEEPTLAEAVNGIKKRKQQEQEARDNKKAKKPNENAPIGSSENEQNAILLGFATISLGRDVSVHLIVDGRPITESQPSIHFEDEHEPTPFIPLIHKVEEEEQPPQPPQEEKNPSADEEQHLEVEDRPVQTQFVVEVISIYPTQEVFDISSGSDDEPEPTPIQVLIPKAEVDHVSSPRAKSIIEVLLSMNQEYPTHSERDDAPSFNLGINYGTRPQPTQEESLLTTQTRMLGTHGHDWMDKKKKKPHDIGTLKNHEEYKGYLDKDRFLTHRFLFAPVLFSDHWWLYVLDVIEKEFFVIDSKNIVTLGDDRMAVNRFAPNEHDCGVYIMKWMEMIDPTILKDCSTDNKEYNIETWT
ncbi:hypothetical protein PIB30_044634 [Stylosanthes scabra]|uniref:Ubiquitin-like protease family profile domain-containing protein n=1 Tax=Stylosanthes scabra TaxID=79078 RepID=A0ABU6VI55_9FABA|nr:hypothetical protein [Stylosanthes scabra]